MLTMVTVPTEDSVRFRSQTRLAKTAACRQGEGKKQAGSTKKSSPHKIVSKTDTERKRLVAELFLGFQEKND